MQGDFDLSLPADGLLAAALMTGLMLSAPTAAQLSRHYPSLKLISAGLRYVWHPLAPTLSTLQINATFRLQQHQHQQQGAAARSSVTRLAGIANTMHGCLPALALRPCSLWILGAAGCALAPSFALLLPCRLLVGAACGPFIALAAPLIDDLAPPPKKSLWLALLFVCIPTGFAVGFLFGGLVSHCYCSVSAL